VPTHSASRWGLDPRRPLFITEGARKADAGVSAGLCTIALLGVWNWRGSNEFGGKTALADWDSIALNERDVFIVFDSDVVVKAPVHAAMSRLKAFLELRRARVRVIYLPVGPGGEKVGLDDFFAAGHSVDELLSHASHEVREVAGATRRSAYEITSDGRTVRWKQTRDGEVEETIANFTAEIVAIVEEDDGVETARAYRLRARVGGKEQEIDVPVPTFQAMNWSAEMLEHKAIVSAGLGAKDRLREAIQTLSTEGVPTHRIYRHTGWIKRGGHHIYLHAAGGIGALGVVEGIIVRLDPPLGRFVLPPPPEGEDPLLVAAPDAARLCAMGTSSWRRMDRCGAVPRPVKLGRRRLWPVVILRRWAELGCPGRAAFEARANTK
jgi:hypothetical protein